MFETCGSWIPEYLHYTVEYRNVSFPHHSKIFHAVGIDLSFLDRISGKGGELVDRGDNTYGGKYVVNPSGGLISKGHPLGATGQYRLLAFVCSYLSYICFQSASLYRISALIVNRAWLWGEICCNTSSEATAFLAVACREDSPTQDVRHFPEKSRTDPGLFEKVYSYDVQFIVSACSFFVLSFAHLLLNSFI